VSAEDPPLTSDEELAAVTVGPPERLDGPVTLVDSDPEWPAMFEREVARIRGALDDRVVLIEHVGSTSVPGLVAKPIIDIVLVVADAADEAAYVPALESAGYRLRIRSPEWEQHRMFKGPDTDVNLHVFGPGSTEVERMLRFRDRLRADSTDRERYAHEKRRLASRTWAYVQHYADSKADIVEAILARARDLADGLPEHARINRAGWTAEAAQYVASAERDWADDEINWGIWHVPESEVGALPDVKEKDVVELGCGTAYVSAWLARRGARPTGVDITEAQLATARRMQIRHGLEFPLIHASAEAVPLPDACADVVVSEYGASLWCEPEAWISEAARLLRPGGRLVFLTNSLLVALTQPTTGVCSDRLVRPQRGLYALTWPDDEGVEFHLSHGEWIALLLRHGLTVTALHELYAPDDAEPTRYDWVTPDWAQRWPVEEIWTARKASDASGVL
jgi:GrpB-like predicted nucleotidyltransferase (UPF0157 family)/protein-L-isoaspartate O-methyltransferase